MSATEASRRELGLINQTVARIFVARREDPEGKRFKRRGITSAWITIIGVVGCTSTFKPALHFPPRAEMYLPYQQQEFFPPDIYGSKNFGRHAAAGRAGSGNRFGRWNRQQPVSDVMPTRGIG